MSPHLGSSHSQARFPEGCRAKERETEARRRLLQTWRSSLAPSRVYAGEHFPQAVSAQRRKRKEGFPFPHLTRNPGALGVQEAKGPRVDCASSLRCLALQ